MREIKPFIRIGCTCILRGLSEIYNEADGGPFSRMVGRPRNSNVSAKRFRANAYRSQKDYGDGVRGVKTRRKGAVSAQIWNCGVSSKIARFRGVSAAAGRKDEILDIPRRRSRKTPKRRIARSNIRR